MHGGSGPIASTPVDEKPLSIPAAPTKSCKCKNVIEYCWMNVYIVQHVSFKSCLTCRYYIFYEWGVIFCSTCHYDADQVYTVFQWVQLQKDDLGHADTSTKKFSKSQGPKLNFFKIFFRKFENTFLLIQSTIAKKIIRYLNFFAFL